MIKFNDQEFGNYVVLVYLIHILVRTYKMWTHNVNLYTVSS